MEGLLAIAPELPAPQGWILNGLLLLLWPSAQTREFSWHCPFICLCSSHRELLVLSLHLSFSFPLLFLLSPPIPRSFSFPFSLLKIHESLMWISQGSSLPDSVVPTLCSCTHSHRLSLLTPLLFYFPSFLFFFFFQCNWNCFPLSPTLWAVFSPIIPYKPGGWWCAAVPDLLERRSREFLVWVESREGGACWKKGGE